MKAALTETFHLEGSSSELRDSIAAVCRRIPPAWPLTNFVAVNPFTGLGGTHFLDAAVLMRRAGHAEMLMPAAYYLERIEAGGLTAGDFDNAMGIAKGTPGLAAADFAGCATLEGLRLALRQGDLVPDEDRLWTFSEVLDRVRGGNWSGFIIDEVSKWCSVYFDRGQSAWGIPWREGSLFDAWKGAASLDANPEVAGLRGFRALVKSMPTDPFLVIEIALDRLKVSDSSWTDFLHRELMSVFGWSSHVQNLARRRAAPGAADELAQLLAARMVYELALANQFGGEPGVVEAWERQWERDGREDGGISEGLKARYLAQQALECAYQRELAARLAGTGSLGGPGPRRAEVQAVFCIDTREEVLRRRLEALSPGTETHGCAGFFGMPVEFLSFGESKGRAQCPALLTPKYRVREGLRDGGAGAEAQWLGRARLRENLASVWEAFKISPASCFSFVEGTGLWAGVALARESLGFGKAGRDRSTGRERREFRVNVEREIHPPLLDGGELETGIILADRIILAAGALRAAGLTTGFAPLVLLCGHGAESANNPYGTALHCGACGGNPGHPNARVAAAILNQPRVRAGLRREGIEIPEDTLFIAGLHNTTTDEVVIQDREEIPPGRRDEVARLEGWLAGACRGVREERAVSMGLKPQNPGALAKAFRTRARDWSQPRAEWGLAGNAAMVVAPRERTRSLNLQGRVFLQEYNPEGDPDGKMLEAIMAAPVVVGSWINLEYYASTVDNRRFGSGNKLIHNVVGNFGVWEGNSGDLQPGLPLQSVHDGLKWRHEPLRLAVFIEAPRGRIDRVLQAREGSRELVENGWVQLFAIDSGSGGCWRRVGGGHWVKA